MKVAVSTRADQVEAYEIALKARFNVSTFDFQLVSLDDPANVDVLVYSPRGEIKNFSPYVNLRYIQSLWAGVDGIITNSTLTKPLCRMVDDGLRLGMREYVCGHILADHQFIQHFAGTKTWDDSYLPSLASSKTVGILGLGELGQCVASALRELGFKVIGWARGTKNLPFPTYTSEAGLSETLSKSDYVITLLPDTDATKNIVNDKFFVLMKPTAMLINPGRGSLVDERTLLKALDEGNLRRAVLDVFKTEPLPQNHPFWAHPKIMVTPHIAAATRVDTAVEVIMENLERATRGESLIHLVDFERGY